MRFVRDYALWLALAAVAGVFAALSPEFLGSRNLSLLMIELSTTATLALGMLLVILPGQIDLSAGSGVGLIGGAASVLIFHQRWPAPLALAAGSALAVALWAAMGRVIVKEKMPAFIITLGGLLVFKGLFWLVIRNATVPVVEGGRWNMLSALTTTYLPPAAGYALAGAFAAAYAWSRFRSAGEDRESAFLTSFVAAQAAFLFVVVMNRFRGVPLPVLVLGAMTAAVYMLTEHTPFGRYLYAIGGNEEAAVLSGIPVDRVVVAAFGLMGAAVAVTGFLQTAYAGASTTTVGDLMELDAIAACVIGGTSLKGGRGTAFGVLSGALIMATLLNGMTLLAVAPELKFIVRGGVLALAVWLDVRLSRA
jgi:D-xylose transport system permease protein